MNVIYYYVIGGFVLFLIFITALFFFLFKKMQNKARQIDCEVYLKDSSKDIIPMKITDEFLVKDKGMYIIASEGIKEEKCPEEVKRIINQKGRYILKKEFIRSKYVNGKIKNFISFIEGIETPLIITPDIAKGALFTGAEAIDQMFKTKLIKELNYEAPNGIGRMTMIGIAIAIIIILAIAGAGVWFGLKKMRGK